MPTYSSDEYKEKRKFWWKLSLYAFSAGVVVGFIGGYKFRSFIAEEAKEYASTPTIDIDIR